MPRADPDRRDRIIDAALECVARDGVAGTSHRKVAQQARVPLGSMTYHFAGMDELLVEAFTRFAATMGQAFEDRLASAHDRDSLVAALVDLIHGDLQRSVREQVLGYELYTLAARRPEFRAITQGWMRASRTALRRHLDATTARIVDAYIEGAAMHIALDPQPQTARVTRDAVRRLVGG